MQCARQGATQFLMPETWLRNWKSICTKTRGELPFTGCPVCVGVAHFQQLTGSWPAELNCELMPKLQFDFAFVLLTVRFKTLVLLWMRGFQSYIMSVRLDKRFSQLNSVSRFGYAVFRASISQSLWINDFHRYIILGINSFHSYIILGINCFHIYSVSRFGYTGFRANISQSLWINDFHGYITSDDLDKLFSRLR